jgi:transcriptional regulator with XRE-family HTH domain
MSKNIEHSNLKKFGADVALIRSSKGYTQEQLASRSGLDRMTIALIENGRRWPRFSTLQTLAKELGVEIKDFFKNL